MRRFVLVGHDAPTTPEFSLDALPSEAGRLDLLCRAVVAALLVSHDVREDVRVHLVLGEEVTVTFDGATVSRLNPDERSTAALVRTALEHKEEAVGHVAVESSPGVTIARKGFETTLAEVAAEGTLVQLHEDGDPVVDLDPPTDPVFVLSDHRDLTDAETAHLADHDARRVCLSTVAVQAADAVAIAHNYLDTDGFRTYRAGT
jgi:tRNA (pseudouridine54-N1)-methyltransferase